MGKKNVKANNTMVDQSGEELQPGAGDAATTQAAPVSPETGKETVEKELAGQPEENGSGQTSGEGCSELDSGNQEKAGSQEGDGAGDQPKGDGHNPGEPKEKTEKRRKIADEVFQKHAGKKTLYFTADLVPFFERSDANKHATTLEDDTVVTLNKK